MFVLRVLTELNKAPQEIHLVTEPVLSDQVGLDYQGLDYQRLEEVVNNASFEQAQRLTAFPSGQTGS
jgi:hypothetical protein